MDSGDISVGLSVEATNWPAGPQLCSAFLTYTNRAGLEKGECHIPRWINQDLVKLISKFADNQCRWIQIKPNPQSPERKFKCV